MLPALVAALEFGGSQAASILPLILQLGTDMPPDDYPTLVIAPVVKLFASADRGTRMALLERLPDFADRLDQKIVTDKIWPHLVCLFSIVTGAAIQEFITISSQRTGFDDTVAVIREATVRSVSLLSTKVAICSPYCNARLQNCSI